MKVELEPYEVEHLKDVLRWHMRNGLEQAEEACTAKNLKHVEFQLGETSLSLFILGTLDWASCREEIEEKPKAQLASVTPIGTDAAASPTEGLKRLDAPEEAVGPKA